MHRRHALQERMVHFAGLNVPYCAKRHLPKMGPRFRGSERNCGIRTITVQKTRHPGQGKRPDPGPKRHTLGNGVPAPDHVRGRLFASSTHRPG